MPTFQHSVEVPVPAAEAYRWHLAPGAFERLAPPWERMTPITGGRGLFEGARVELEVGRGPLRTRMTVVHRDFEAGRGFVDEQEVGPLRRWVHRHRFRPLSDTACAVDDQVEWELPLGGHRLSPTRSWFERELGRMFAYRAFRLRRDLGRHRPIADRPRLTTAVSGASGVIGRALAAFLETGGDRVVRLVRRPPRPGADEIFWDPERGELDAAGLEGLSAVVHLAGESLTAGRWTPARKRSIAASRTRGAELLAGTLARLSRPPRALLSASAVGYYGGRDAGDECGEDAGRGEGFLAELCAAWEGGTAAAAAAGIRVVNLRIGVVLSARGGALAKMAPAFRLGLGGPAGDGRQSISWVSLDDAVFAIHHLLRREDLHGPFNLTAPRPATNAELARALGRALGRPALVRAPAWLVRRAYGEMGEALLLSGADVRPVALLSSGYEFADVKLEATLRRELGRGA